MKDKLNIEIKKKIIFGLELANKKMLEQKRQNGNDVVIVKQGKIVRIKP